MKVLILIVTLTTSLFVDSGQACIPFYLPYFDLPSYVDPDFKDPGYTDMVLGRKYMIANILRECENLRPPTYNQIDIPDRELSKKMEPIEFAAYERAAAFFRAEEYDSALASFEILHKTIEWKRVNPFRSGTPFYQSWVREASTYMIARSHLKLAQKNWHGYSRWSIDIDSAASEKAAYIFSEYLSEYPNGIYSYSARNLKRFFCNFSNDYCNLDSALIEAMRERFPVEIGSQVTIDRSHDVVAEFLLYFKGEADLKVDPPVTLVCLFMGENQITENDIAVLSKRKSEFASLPGLFEFVLSTGLYRLGNFHQLIESTAQIAGPRNRIWLSTMLLRARSFVSLGFPDSALNVLQEMYNVSPEDAIEVEMAVTTLNSGTGLWLCSNLSPISDEEHLTKFAIFGLSDSDMVSGLVRSDIVGDKKAVLVNELAKRYLLSDQYVLLDKLLSTHSNCNLAAIHYLIQALIKNPKDVVALVDLGEFTYNLAIAPWKSSESPYLSPWRADGREVLVHRCIPCTTLTKSHLHPPELLFRKVVELVKKNGKRSEAEAKALHFLIVGGRSLSFDHIRLTWNYGDRSGSNLEFNKAAFRRLHRLYKDSPWAKATPYYYQ